MRAPLSFRFSARAGPYQKANSTRVSKNRSPPPPSRSRSASIISEPSATDVTSSRSGNRECRLRTANRRVRFTPEVEVEQAADPENKTPSDNSAVSETPARAHSVT